MKIVAHVVACIVAAFLATGSASQAQEMETPLVCRRTEQPVPYFCRPTGQFWGAAIGMSADDAFHGLCRELPQAVWSVSVDSTSPSSSQTKGLSCDQWPRFAHSKIWVLVTSGYPCEKTAFAVIVVDHSKLVNYTVMCGKLKDARLLAGTADIIPLDH